MPINSVPYPNQDYQLDVTWPSDVAVGVGSAFQQNGNPKYGIGSSYQVFGAQVGTATNNMGVYAGVLCGQFTCNGAGLISGRTTDGFSVFAPLLRNGSAPGMKFGAELRVWRLNFNIAFASGASLTTLTGLVVEPCAAVAPGWIDGGNRGFGIVGNPAGGLQYVEKNAGGVGVYQFQQALAWPSLLTRFVTVDYEIVAASGAGDAVFNLYLNNLLVLQRSWAAGASMLPDYTSPPNAARFSYQVQMGEPGVADTLFLAAGMRFMAGMFTLAGAIV